MLEIKREIILWMEMALTLPKQAREKNATGQEKRN